MESILSDVLGFLAGPFSGLTLAVISILLSVWFFMRSRRRTRLHFTVPSGSRSVANVAGASLRTPGTTARLVGVKVALWNSGTNVIRSDDVAPGDHLHVRTAECSPIAYYQVAEQTRAANRMCAERLHDASTLEISFDYLDPGDGANVTIVYEGKERENIFVDGSIIGGGSPVRRQRRELGVPLPLVGGLFLTGWGFVFFGRAVDATAPSVSMVSMTIGLVFYPVSLVLAQRFNRQRGVPSSLKPALETSPSILELVMRESYKTSVFAAIEHMIQNKTRSSGLREA